MWASRLHRRHVGVALGAASRSRRSDGWPSPRRRAAGRRSRPSTGRPRLMRRLTLRPPRGLAANRRRSRAPRRLRVPGRPLDPYSWGPLPPPPTPLGYATAPTFQGGAAEGPDRRMRTRSGSPLQFGENDRAPARFRAMGPPAAPGTARAATAARRWSSSPLRGEPPYPAAARRWSNGRLGYAHVTVTNAARGGTMAAAQKPWVEGHREGGSDARGGN